VTRGLVTITPNELILDPFLAKQFNTEANDGRYPIVHVETRGEIWQARRDPFDKIYQHRGRASLL
jgi:hypothetical protein